ncbi:MAG: histidine kinase dimerization/phospho-acceptor domain-containing protein, partial [Gemmatimonadota bacterium]
MEAEPARPADPERVKRAALAHMRHELRTPINAILGYSEMLMEEDAPEEVVPDLRRIHEGGRQLLGLVDTILASDRAGDAERDLDSFGARIRADLRTPINAVVGYAEMLIESEREAGREALIPDLERILVAARRLLDLSGDIVKLATAAPDAAMGANLADTASMTSGVLSKIRPTEAGSPTV